MADLPVPLSFRLPDPAWRPVDPASVGVPGAAFLAVRSAEPGDDYSPTLTVSGAVQPATRPLEEIADEAVDLLRADTGDAELVKRREHGNPDNPGLLQQVDCRLPADAGGQDVRQMQALLRMRDLDDPAVVQVVKIVLSTTYRQHQTYLPEFQEFLASVRPASAG